MAVKYTEEQLNSVDKSFLIQLLLQQQEQLEAITKELRASNEKMQLLMEQVILGKQNRFGRSSEKMEDTSQICFQEVSNRNYKNIMIKTIKNVLMPMMIISVFMFYFRGWLVDGVSLMESVSYSAMDYRKVIETLLTWRNPVNGMGHLWYLYVYIWVMISFPVLKFFVDYLTQNNRREIYFLIISLTLFLVNDITENQLFAFSHYSINGWFPASIEVIWGAILYQHKDAILKICKSPLLWGTGFMGINLVRCKIQFMQYQVDENKHVLYWYTLFGIVCTICIMFFAFSIMNYIKSTKYKNSICSLAGETFTIYLIHSCIIKMLNRFGIQSAIVEKLSKTGSGILFEVLYTGTMIFLVFLISFFLAKIINMCYKKLWKRI